MYASNTFYFSVIQCPTPILPVNDVAFIDCSDKYNFGSLCVFTCPIGHSLVGSKSLLCGGDGLSLVGEWDEDYPKCEGITILNICSPLFRRAYSQNLGQHF